MDKLLKMIHFKMFEYNEEEKRLTSIHGFPAKKCGCSIENVRNDEKIGACRNIKILLNDIEKEILKRM
jgi:hypothetical protein